MLRFTNRCCGGAGVVLLLCATTFFNQEVSALGGHAPTNGFTAELFGNVVMRGTPRCTSVQPNGFALKSLMELCSSDSGDVPHHGVQPLDPLVASVRLTGTLTPSMSDPQWYNFTVTTTESAWLRVWVDDHRIIDQWSGPHTTTPVTPGLLPNVTMSSQRPVFVRIDMRPWDNATSFRIDWQLDGGNAIPVPTTALSPTVSREQQERRALQERAASGWNQWHRKSNLAQIILPHQIGIDLAIVDRDTGAAYRYGLLTPQFHSAVPVRMGMHAYDGSYSALSVVPFPTTTTRANVSVQSAVVNGTSQGGLPPDNTVLVTTNLTTATSAPATGANLSLVVYPTVYYDAYANVTVRPALSGAPQGIDMDVGELGILHVSFSDQILEVAASENDPAPSLFFALTAGTPFGITLSFTRTTPLAASDVVNIVKAGERATLQEIVRGSTDPNAVARRLHERRRNLSSDVSNGSSAVSALEYDPAVAFNVYDAQMTAMAWNVNFDPRVSVTAPVSRTFESGFDFIFFDWDMFFLSLMATTAPAGDNTHAFAIGVSNLIETAQTRSAYGQVMNKRAASGADTSDTNDRSEPFVGAMVLHRIYRESLGTPREATLTWVVKLLFPSLLGWNQWAWHTRRYNVRLGGLIVLGSDNNEPCEGSTVGKPDSRTHCASKNAAILESGMDNSPMYFNSFDDPTGKNPKRIGADYDDAAGRVQLYDVQQSALFVSESVSLQALATAAGEDTSVVDMLQTQATDMAARINAMLWDDHDGIYKQVDASSQQRGFSPAISPTSFYPMIANISSIAQVQRMVAEHLTNQSEFCVDAGPAFRTEPLQQGCYPVPSISRSDPNFLDNTYWRGRTWGPLNLLVWIALSNDVYKDIPQVASARKGLVSQSKDLLLNEFMRFRHVHENYNSLEGVGCDVPNSNPFYHWGALLGYVWLKELEL